jgi:hypothetical protein
MNKKEWLEVCKQSLYSVLAMAGMVLLVGLMGLLQGKSFDGEKIIIMLGLWLLMFSLFLGLSLFALDSQQKGMEYLLTLPFSRRRLLFIKLLPRLAAAVLFYGVFFLLYRLIGNDAFGGYFDFFSLSYFALFFISFSFSSIHENFVVQSIWAGLALCGYLTLCSLILTQGFAWSNNFSLGSVWRFGHFGNIIYDSSSMIAALIVFLLLLTPFIASYFLAFKKFDLRPARAFNRRQLLFFVPLLLLAMAASLGVSYQLQKGSMFGHSDFYLTESGQLLKANWPGKLTVYDENSRKQIDTKKAVFWNRVLLEKGQQLFLLGYDTEDGSDIIIRLNMKDFSWKTLHQVPDRYLAGNSFYSFSYDGESFVNLQRSRTEADRPGMDSCLPLKSDVLELIMVDPLSGKSRAISYRSPLFQKYYEPQIIGCDERNGLRFWLVAHKWSNVLRLWEDGRVDDLGFSKGSPAYFGNLLFTVGDNSLQVRKLLEKGSEIIKEITGNIKLVQSIYSLQVSNGLNEMYAIRNKRIVRIDLANLAVDDVGTDRGLIYLVPPGDFYYVEFENWPGQGTDKWKKLYRLQGGKMVLLKQFDFNDAGYGDVYVETFGVILRQYKMVSKISNASKRIFAFPDLRELKLKN